MHDSQARKLAVAIKLAVNKPQILQYMRDKILKDIIKNLDTLTDQQVEEYLSEANKER